MEIEFTIQIWRAGDRYMAHVMPLDVMSGGETIETARTAAEEAVRNELRTARMQGKLIDYLQDHGYSWAAGAWHGPEWLSLEMHSISLES